MYRRIFFSVAAVCGLAFVVFALASGRLFPRPSSPSVETPAPTPSPGPAHAPVNRPAPSGLPGPPDPNEATPSIPAPPPVQPANPPLAPDQTGPAISALPIQGLKPTDLHDMFDEVHAGQPHHAIDIMEPRGTPVHAVVTGTIEKLFESKPGGHTIYQFNQSGTYCYYYAHLDRYADGLHEGQRVSPGDVIAYVGSSGNADANSPHLHFEVLVLGPEKHWWQGTDINPYPILMQLLNPGR